MADAGDASNGLTDNGQNAEVILAGIALVISCMAFFTSLLQVFQQYYASASGYASCKAKTIGPWCEGTQRVFKWKELRFEVLFWTPVIFLSHPGNTNGPILGEDLWEVTGDEESYQKTMTPRNEKLGEDQSPRLNNKQLVHTADNEQSTWITLLKACQRRENKTKGWSVRIASRDPIATDGVGNTTLVVFVQKKRRSWDTMPGNIKKPYATTTICHLVEMAAVLGLHWKEFNRSTHRYRAEGNGYIMTGENIADLGIMFVFQSTGASVFEETSIVPVDEVKDLCFGFVPTMFRGLDQKGAHLLPIDELPEDLNFLQLGTVNEVKQTLVQMGCNTNTVRHFEDEKSNVSHLFPIVFELVGMLGRVLHIRRNPWRMLPNPTIYAWENRSFDVAKMLGAFGKCINDAENAKDFSSAQIRKLRKSLGRIQEVQATLAKSTSATTVGPRIPLLDTLHDAVIEVDGYLGNSESKEAMLKVVTHVIRHHLQVLLELVNAENSPFDRLDKEQPEGKQLVLMEIYFGAVREKVLSKATNDRYMFQHINTVRTILVGGETEVNGGSGASGGTRSNATTATMTTTSAPTVVGSGQPSPTASGSNLANMAEPVPDKNPEAETMIINDIWCTLVFRMLCWLLLHDFHKKDVQLPKSELIGSRLPVYIA